MNFFTVSLLSAPTRLMGRVVQGTAPTMGASASIKARNVGFRQVLNIIFRLNQAKSVENMWKIKTRFRQNPVSAKQGFGGLTCGDLSPWNWDNRITGDEVTGDKPTPPKVWALGPCTGSNCREGKEGAITINDQDQGDVFGKTSKKITVSFFTAANSNQMPIRQIIVDWGDGKNTTPPWPTDSQSGSTASDNFYKNHRGLDNSGEPRCTSDANEFGLSPEACSASYVAFNHDYTCTTARVKELENDPRSSQCKHAPDGRLLNSPCTDGESCFYQPRVHIKDNWGWCTGFCDAGQAPGGDGTNGCFEGGGSANNECNVSVCPSKADPVEEGNNKCPDYHKASSVVNPWVNYNGYVIIEPEV